MNTRILPSLLLLACTGSEPVHTPPVTETEADADTDTDTDADADADTDADTDSDTDADTDADPVVAPLVRFIALGDAGTGMPVQSEVAEAADTVCGAEGCDFAVYLGDNFYNCGVTDVNDPLWGTLYEDVYSAWSNLQIPFHAVLGNHAYYGQEDHPPDDSGGEPDGPRCGPSGGIEQSQGQAQVDYTTAKYPGDTWFHMPGLHWREAPADEGEYVALVGLDTERIVRGFDDLGEVGQSEQWTTLAGEMAASTAPVQVVLAHHPYRSNGSHGNAGVYDHTIPGDSGSCDPTTRIPDSPQAGRSGVCMAEYVEEHICGKAQLYLSGHDHNLQLYESVEGCEGTMFVVSGAAGKSSGKAPTAANEATFEHYDPGLTWVELCGPQARVEQIVFYDGFAAELHRWEHPERETVPCVDE